MKKLARNALILLAGFSIGMVSNSGLISPGAREYNRASTQNGGRPEGNREAAARFRSSDRSRIDGQYRSRSRTAIHSRMLRQIMWNEDPLERGRLLHAIIDRLNSDEFPSIVEQFRRLGVLETRTDEYRLLLMAWALHDPTSALDFVASKPMIGTEVGSILTSWASHDPEGALQWSVTNSHDRNQNMLLASVIQGIARNDLDRATGLMLEMPACKERQVALDGIIPHVVSGGAAAANKWLLAIEDDEARKSLASVLAPKLAFIDPSAAIEMSIANPINEVTDRINQTVIFGRFASRDFDNALRTLDALPPGNVREAAVSGIVAFLTSHGSSRERAQFLDDQSQNTDRERLSKLCRDFVRDDFSTAVRMAQMIKDTQIRQDVYRESVEFWNRKEPDSVRAWFTNQEVPEELGMQYLGVTEG